MFSGSDGLLSACYTLWHCYLLLALLIFLQIKQSTVQCLLHPFPLLSFSITSFGFSTGEPVSECRRYVQFRNITKGNCGLDNVEVSFCRGRCLSRTDVTLEVWICQHLHTNVFLLCSYSILIFQTDKKNEVRSH